MLNARNYHRKTSMLNRYLSDLESNNVNNVVSVRDTGKPTNAVPDLRIQDFVPPQSQSRMKNDEPQPPRRHFRVRLFYNDKNHSSTKNNKRKGELIMKKVEKTPSSPAKPVNEIVPQISPMLNDMVDNLIKNIHKSKKLYFSKTLKTVIGTKRPRSQSKRGCQPSNPFDKAEEIKGQSEKFVEEKTFPDATHNIVTNSSLHQVFDGGAEAVNPGSEKTASGSDILIEHMSVEIGATCGSSSVRTKSEVHFPSKKEQWKSKNEKHHSSDDSTNKYDAKTEAAPRKIKTKILRHEQPLAQEGCKTRGQKPEQRMEASETTKRRNRFSRSHHFKKNRPPSAKQRKSPLLERIKENVQRSRSPSPRHPHLISQNVPQTVGEAIGEQLLKAIKETMSTELGTPETRESIGQQLLSALREPVEQEESIVLVEEQLGHSQDDLIPDSVSQDSLEQKKSFDKPSFASNTKQHAGQHVSQRTRESIGQELLEAMKQFIAPDARETLGQEILQAMREPRERKIASKVIREPIGRWLPQTMRELIGRQLREALRDFVCVQELSEEMRSSIGQQLQAELCEPVDSTRETFMERDLIGDNLTQAQRELVAGQLFEAMKACICRDQLPPSVRESVGAEILEAMQKSKISKHEVRPELTKEAVGRNIPEQMRETVGQQLLQAMRSMIGKEMITQASKESAEVALQDLDQCMTRKTQNVHQQTKKATTVVPRKPRARKTQRNYIQRRQQERKEETLDTRIADKAQQEAIDLRTPQTLKRGLSNNKQEDTKEGGKCLNIDIDLEISNQFLQKTEEEGQPQAVKRSSMNQIDKKRKSGYTDEQIPRRPPRAIDIRTQDGPIATGGKFQTSFLPTVNIDINVTSPNRGGEAVTSSGFRSPEGIHANKPKISEPSDDPALQTRPPQQQIYQQILPTTPPQRQIYQQILPITPPQRQIYQEVLPTTPPQQQIYQEVLPTTPPQQQIYQEVLPTTPPQWQIYQEVLPTTPPQQQIYQQILPTTPPQRQIYQQILPTTPPQQQIYQEVLPTTPAQQQIYQQILPTTPPQQQIYQEVLPTTPPQQKIYQEVLPTTPPQRQIYQQILPTTPLQQQPSQEILTSIPPIKPNLDEKLTTTPLIQHMSPEKPKTASPILQMCIYIPRDTSPVPDRPDVISRATLPAQQTAVEIERDNISPTQQMPHARPRTISTALQMPRCPRTTPSIPQIPHAMPRTTPQVQYIAQEIERTTPSVQQMPHVMPRTTPSVQYIPQEIHQTTPPVQYIPQEIQRTTPLVPQMPHVMPRTSPSVQYVHQEMQRITPSDQYIPQEIQRTTPLVPQMPHVMPRATPPVQYIPQEMQRITSPDQYIPQEIQRTTPLVPQMPHVMPRATPPVQYILEEIPSDTPRIPQMLVQMSGPTPPVSQARLEESKKTSAGNEIVLEKPKSASSVQKTAQELMGVLPVGQNVLYDVPTSTIATSLWVNNTEKQESVKDESFPSEVGELKDIKRHGREARCHSVDTDTISGINISDFDEISTIGFQTNTRSIKNFLTRTETNDWQKMPIPRVKESIGQFQDSQSKTEKTLGTRQTRPSASSEKAPRKRPSSVKKEPIKLMDWSFASQDETVKSSKLPIPSIRQSCIGISASLSDALKPDSETEQTSRDEMQKAIHSVSTALSRGTTKSKTSTRFSTTRVRQSFREMQESVLKFLEPEDIDRESYLSVPNDEKSDESEGNLPVPSVRASIREMSDSCRSVVTKPAASSSVVDEEQEKKSSSSKTSTTQHRRKSFTIVTPSGYESPSTSESSSDASFHRIAQRVRTDSAPSDIHLGIDTSAMQRKNRLFRHETTPEDSLYVTRGVLQAPVHCIHGKETDEYSEELVSELLSDGAAASVSYIRDRTWLPYHRSCEMRFVIEDPSEKIRGRRMTINQRQSIYNLDINALKSMQKGHKNAPLRMMESAFLSVKNHYTVPTITSIQKMRPIHDILLKIKTGTRDVKQEARLVEQRAHKYLLTNC